MQSYNAATRIPATSEYGLAYAPERPVAIIADEPDWRVRPYSVDLPSGRPEIVTTRWHTSEQGTREVRAETGADCHLISIVLRNENVQLSVAGRTVHDGVAMPGMLHVTEPAVPSRCIFRGPYDVLHLHVPNSMVAEFDRDITGRDTTRFSLGATLTRDPLVEPLGRALLDADELGGSFGKLYADSVSTAILAHLVGLSRRAGASRRPTVSGLAKWRLKRAIDYIESRLAEPVTLADVAAATGLTRMHFAAQFRAATGLRPHEYLLRRRIERAQEMLAGTALPVVEVALSVGFQTQSQFTTVFKRFTGRPPHAWRQANGVATVAA